MAFSQKESSSNLLYATNHSSIVLLDLYTMRVLLSMENPRHYGPIVSFCLDRKRTWLVTATFSGVLCLWDLRFGLLLRTWTVGASVGINNVRIRQCTLHPSKGRGRWILVALDGAEMLADQPGTVLIEVWDVERGELVETFISRDVSNNLATDSLPIPPKHEDEISTDTSPAAAIAALVKARQQGDYPPALPFGDTIGQHVNQSLSQPSRTITCIVTGTDFGEHTSQMRSFVDLSKDVEPTGRSSGKTGFLVVGSEDCSVKLYDLERFERSVILSERDGEHEKTAFS